MTNYLLLVLNLKKEQGFINTTCLCFHGILQTVLYFYFEYQIELLCKTFTHNAVLSVTNRLLTSLVVASVSYHNCTNKPVTHHVTVQSYFQYYIRVTSLFRVLLCDVQK